MKTEGIDQWTQNNWLEFIDEFGNYVETGPLVSLPIALNKGDLITHCFFNVDNLKNDKFTSQIVRVKHNFDTEEFEYYRIAYAVIPDYIFKNEKNKTQ
jgi:hypothetical protein